MVKPLLQNDGKGRTEQVRTIVCGSRFVKAHALKVPAWYNKALKPPEAEANNRRVELVKR